MRNLRQFNIRSISRNLNGINARISAKNNILFPCLTTRSHYRFKKRFVKLLPNWDIQGGFTRMIISLIDCPCDTLPEKIKRPRIEAMVMKIDVMEEPVSENQINTAILFGVKEQLDKQGLCLNTIQTNIAELAPDLDRIILRCPKIPTDTDARIGVRNDPKNSARKQKIFGYNMVLSTSVEVHLKLELPVAVVNMAGNGKEGKKSSPWASRPDPTRTAKALRERGYDRNGPALLNFQKETYLTG